MSEALVTVEDGYTEEEIRALERHRKKNGAPIATSTAIDFFSLYLEGYTIKQIHERHSAWPLGALVDARVRYKWDDKKKAYLEELETQVMDRMSKIKLESLNFLADMAAVAHNEFREEMIKYLQNPDNTEPPRNRIKSIREYKELMNIIVALGALGAEGSGMPGTAIQVNVADGGRVEVVTANEKARMLQALAEEE
jgi:hypothetical protein